MIVVKVWCLPIDQDEEALNLLHKAIVKAVVFIFKLRDKYRRSFFIVVMSRKQHHLYLYQDDGCRFQVRRSIGKLLEPPPRSQNLHNYIYHMYINRAYINSVYKPGL